MRSLRQGAVGLGALQLEMAELVPGLRELPAHGLELVARLGAVGGSARFGELGFDRLGVRVERVERAACGLELGGELVGVGPDRSELARVRGRAGSRAPPARLRARQRDARASVELRVCASPGSLRGRPRSRARLPDRSRPAVSACFALRQRWLRARRPARDSSLSARSSSSRSASERAIERSSSATRCRTCSSSRLADARCAFAASSSSARLTTVCSRSAERASIATSSAWARSTSACMRSARASAWIQRSSTSSSVLRISDGLVGGSWAAGTHGASGSISIGGVVGVVGDRRGAVRERRAGGVAARDRRCVGLGLGFGDFGSRRRVVDGRRGRRTIAAKSVMSTDSTMCSASTSTSGSGARLRARARPRARSRPSARARACRFEARFRFERSRPFGRSRAARTMPAAPASARHRQSRSRAS